MIEFANEITDGFINIPFIWKDFQDDYSKDAFIFTKEVYNKCMEICECDSINELDKLDNDKPVYKTNDGGYINVNRLKHLIREECKENIWFFFKNILRVPCMGGFNQSSIPFTFNAGTYKFIESYNNDDSVSFLYNPRQAGNTTILCGLYLYTKLFKPNYNSKIVARVEDDDKRIRQICNEMMLRIPVFISSYGLSDNDDNIEGTYLFIDEYEYNTQCYISDYMYYILIINNIKVYASTTINDNIPKDISKYIDNIDLIDSMNKCSKYGKSKILFPVNEILNEYSIEKLKYGLDNNKDLIRREIYRERK